MVQKVVKNACFGGFGVSEKAVRRMREMGCEEAENLVLAGEEFPNGETWDGGISGNSVGNEYSMPRDDEHLVKVVEELGSDANGKHAKLRVVELPDGVDWVIDEYDGRETVRQKHSTW